MAAHDRARENGTYVEPQDPEAAREAWIEAEVQQLLKREATRRADDAARGETVARFMMASSEGGSRIECQLLNPDDTATAMQTLAAQVPRSATLLTSAARRS
jgi:hypothetical protein